eukprot:725427-Prymnesium_polylepis.1
MAVHATYQFGDMPDYAFGKRQRFRDWCVMPKRGRDAQTRPAAPLRGMWLVDDPLMTILPP